MGQGSWQASSQQIQLLAMNAFFDMARGGSDVAGACPALEAVSSLAQRCLAAPSTVSFPELESAHAEMLYHALLA